MFKFIDEWIDRKIEHSIQMKQHDYETEIPAEHTPSTENNESENIIDCEYKQVLAVAQMKMDYEIRREDSLIQQASQMQTVFSFFTAAIFMALPVCIEYKGVLTFAFFYGWISLIIGAMLISLVCASVAQWRWQTKGYSQIGEIEKAVLNDEQWEKYVHQYYCDKQRINIMEKIDDDRTRLNNRRVSLIIASMIFFWISIGLIAICFFIATIKLWF